MENAQNPILLRADCKGLSFTLDLHLSVYEYIGLQHVQRISCKTPNKNSLTLWTHVIMILFAWTTSSSSCRKSNQVLLSDSTLALFTLNTKAFKYKSNFLKICVVTYVRHRSVRREQCQVISKDTFYSLILQQISAEGKV